MSKHDYLMRHLDRIASKEITTTARERRNRALQSISQYCITVTRDGANLREISTTSPPNLSQLIDMFGEDVYVVSVTMRHKSVSRRLTPMLAAE
jgi:hypothetical protein